MEMSRETINSLSEYFERTFGMPYEDFKKLDYEVQQILISSYKNTQKNKKNNIANVMLGSGEHAIFIKVEKGKRVMIGSGEHSCFIKAGLTPEEEMREFEDRMDDHIYSKPVAFVKKLQRRIKNLNK